MSRYHLEETDGILTELFKYIDDDDGSILFNCHCGIKQNLACASRVPPLSEQQAIEQELSRLEELKGLIQKQIFILGKFKEFRAALEGE